MNGDDLLGKPLSLVVALAIVSLLPFVFMSVTSFVKISTVFQIVRSAIGAQNVPSSTVVMALSAALTVVAMAPVGSRIVDRVTPLVTAKESLPTGTLVRRGLEAVGEPMREFLRANAHDRERARFVTLAKDARPESERDRVSESDFTVLVPAFVVSELGEAFAVGFLVFLPFLVIDLVVANVLLSLGMQMLSPTQVSLPFKLLLFVGIDGWGLLAEALVAGYR
ncbi:MAG: EscR/YscR/HrcR family type III secretion system export apparatus protein [Polyangiaceae bacterium]